MVRKLVPLAVAVVLVVGCKKKAPPTDGETPADPGTAYTLKIRTAAQGDKSEVSGSETTEVEGGPGKNTSQKKYEYTEHILELPAGAKHPTKLTRTYKTAQRTGFFDKKLETLPYQGKTVTIEKKASGYEFSVDGKKMSFQEALDLESEFRNKDTDKDDATESLLPKQPVKVGDTWTPDAEAMKRFGGGMGGDVDAGQSKFTCKLARAYTKDGKMWGTIEFDMNLVLTPKDGSGTLKATGKFDAVLDGSSREGTMTANMNGAFSGNQKGKALEMKVSGNVEKTIKPVK